MSRGRYGTRAALRRESAEVITTIEDYRRAVVKLTEERNELRDALAKERADRSKERRELRAMLAEGLAPELKAREAIIDQLRQRAIHQKGHAQGLLENVRRLRWLLYEALREMGIEGRACKEWIIQKDPAARLGPTLEPELLPSIMLTSMLGDGSAVLRDGKATFG